MGLININAGLTKTSYNYSLVRLREGREKLFDDSDRGEMAIDLLTREIVAF